jgi:glycosyltransferase involved in cell wall biosynthesis
MRIGIDVRYLSHGLMGGVRNYIAYFVQELVQIAHAHELYLYADTKRPFELDAHSFPKNVTLRRLPYHNALSSVYLDVFMRRTVAHDKLDVMHFPANYGFGPRGVRTVITLHDAINVMPLWQVFKNGGRQWTAKWTAMMTYLHIASTTAVRKAHMLLTVSEHARQDIGKTIGFDVDRIVAVPHAPTTDMRPISNAATLQAVREKHGLPPRFVTADALKNPAVLVRAWRLLTPELKRNRKIVFFCRYEPLPIVREAVAAGEAVLLMRPPREDLVALYNMADAFVFPSWFEGFGIPVLEAMACGAPVIASDRYSIPEVVGAAGLIADAEDERAFAQHLSRVLGVPQEAERLRKLGFARAAQFTWRSTAQQILSTYERAARA